MNLYAIYARKPQQAQLQAIGEYDPLPDGDGGGDQKVVSKEVPILTNMAEAFLENACCIDDEEHAIQYFMSRVPALEKYNSFVKQSRFTVIFRLLHWHLAFFHHWIPDVCIQLFQILSMKITHYSYLSSARCFLPQKSSGHCLTKPENISLFDSLSKQIEAIESQGKQFTLDMNRLLMMINREHSKYHSTTTKNPR